MPYLYDVVASNAESRYKGVKIATWYLVRLSCDITLKPVTLNKKAKNNPVILFIYLLAKFMVEDGYSHSIVAGGLLLISYTTLLIPLTLLIMSLEMYARKS